MREPVGHARLEYIWSKFPFLALIYVAPEHRRAGVGTTLLHAIARDLRDASHSLLYSSCTGTEFVECGHIAGINPNGIGEVFFRIAIDELVARLASARDSVNHDR